MPTCFHKIIRPPSWLGSLLFSHLPYILVKIFEDKILWPDYAPTDRSQGHGALTVLRRSKRLQVGGHA